MTDRRTTEPGTSGAGPDAAPAAADAPAAVRVLAGTAQGEILAAHEALSFWGGVDPATGVVIDAHHPLRGACIAGKVLMLPSSRGSCTGSGVLLDLILSGRAPAALVFCEAEDVLTLGALIAAELFDRHLPIVRLSQAAFRAVAAAATARLDEEVLTAGGASLPVAAPTAAPLELTASDRAMLDGRAGAATRQAMRIVRAMAVVQGAPRLIDVTQAHVDGCIYASPANLVFAERMAEIGARVRVPTTMNAISVDSANWRAQGVAPVFGEPAERLAAAYVRMGCRPTFTCAPYLLDGAPAAAEVVAWSESNAVIYANSVLGARTAKHPDFLDLCIAVTGRAPLSGVYRDELRRARRVVDVELPARFDDALWPLVGYLAGRAAPDRIPLLRGLAPGRPTRDDLKALCAAFGTTSAAPMLHVAGVTPEAEGAALDGADRVVISRDDLAAAWASLNEGPAAVELVAIGSPHASLSECRALADAMAGRRASPAVSVIVTAGAQVIAQARAEGLLARLKGCGVQVIGDLCWCSICEPVFPRPVRTVLTNSGKYAHYGPGLSGRQVRLGSLADCVEAALSGSAPPRAFAACPPAGLP